MSLAAIERGTIPSSEAGLTSVESTNSLIRASMALQAGIDRLATFGRKLRAGLAVLSGPTIYPSSSLRPDESPFKEDIDDANNGLLRTLRISPKWALLSAIGGTGFLAACAQTTTDVNIPAIVEKAKPGALAPGIGGAEPLPTFPPGHPREKENPGIDEVNRKDAEARKAATATAEAAAQKPATPEAQKLLDCGILSPEACATGVHLQWINVLGNKTNGVGWVLKPREAIRIKEGLKVSTTILKQPDVFNGVRVLGLAPDGSASFLYVGNFDKNNLGRGNLTIAEGDLTVFDGEPYNFVYLAYGQPGLMNNLAEIMKTPPKIINNKVPEQSASNTAIYYGHDSPPKS